MHLGLGCGLSSACCGRGTLTCLKPGAPKIRPLYSRAQPNRAHPLRPATKTEFAKRKRPRLRKKARDQDPDFGTQRTHGNSPHKPGACEMAHDGVGELEQG